MIHSVVHCSSVLCLLYLQLPFDPDQFSLRISKSNGKTANLLFCPEM